MEKVNTLAGAEKIVLLSQQVHPLGRGWGEAGPKSPHQETRTIRPRIAASQQAPERTRHCPSLHPQLHPNAPCPSFQAQSTPLSCSPRATVTFPGLQAPPSPAGPHGKPHRGYRCLAPSPLSPFLLALPSAPPAPAPITTSTIPSSGRLLVLSPGRTPWRGAWGTTRQLRKPGTPSIILLTDTLMAHTQHLGLQAPLGRLLGDPKRCHGVLSRLPPGLDGAVLPQMGWAEVHISPPQPSTIRSSHPGVPGQTQGPKTGQGLLQTSPMHTTGPDWCLYELLIVKANYWIVSKLV